MLGVFVLGLGVLILLGMLLMTDRVPPESLITLLIAVVSGMLGYAVRGDTNNNGGNVEN